MAVDTRQKRFSMINFGEGDLCLFEADAAVDADDRAHLLGLYSGIALDNPAAIETSPYVLGMPQTANALALSNT